MIDGRAIFVHKTKAELNEANPILLNGEIAFEKDTRRIKVGDGVIPYRFLPYYGGSSLFSWKGWQQSSNYFFGTSDNPVLIIRGNESFFVGNYTKSLTLQSDKSFMLMTKYNGTYRRKLHVKDDVPTFGTVLYGADENQSIKQNRINNIYRTSINANKIVLNTIPAGQMFFNYKQQGDVLRVGLTDNCFLYGSDPAKNTSNRTMSIRVAEYAHDVELGGNAKNVSLGHQAEKVYLRGTDTYIDSVPNGSYGDVGGILVVNSAGKVYKINKSNIKQWLEI